VLKVAIALARAPHKKNKINSFYLVLNSTEKKNLKKFFDYHTKNKPMLN
jgi:hypothetical protein